MNFEKAVRRELAGIGDLLVAKNKSYGNAALDPLRVFSRANPSEQIRVRIDDKLSRLARGDVTALPSETLADTIDDLLGYLILLKISEAQKK